MNGLNDPLLGTLMFISIALIAIGASRILKYGSMAKWIQVDAVIHSIEELCENVPESQYGISKYYYPSINYQYTYKNNTYSSTNVAFNIKNIWVCEYDKYGRPLKDKDKFWYNWKEGAAITAYVNLEKPDESVLINSFSDNYRSHNIALVVGGIILGILWAILSITT